MSITLPRKGADSYGPLDGAVAVAAGLGFWARYAGGSADKDLKAGELADAWAYGVDILANFEDNANDASGGYPAGAMDAAHAITYFRSIAMPTANADGAPVAIYYSVDTNLTADQVRPYFTGIASMDSSGYGVGGYGGEEMVTMLDEGLITYWWQASAASWSNWTWAVGAQGEGWYHPTFGYGGAQADFPTHPRAHVRQVLAPFAPNTDGNWQMKDPCGLWKAPANLEGPEMLDPKDPTVEAILSTLATLDAKLTPVEQALDTADAPDGAGVPQTMHGALKDTLADVQAILAKLQQTGPPGGLSDADVDRIAQAVAGRLNGAQVVLQGATPSGAGA